MKKQILFILLSILFCVYYLPYTIYASKSSDHTIRIAYPIQTGLTEINETGEFSGYTYEYLQEIAQYTGWNYEFVQIPGDINESLLQMMDMVKNGEIDIMGGMLYSEQLEKDYNYSGQSYGLVNTVLQTLESAPITIDSQNPQTLRIAVVKNAKQRFMEIQKYCTMNLITPEYIYCDGDAEQVQALKDGQADVMVNTSLNYIEGLQTIAKFSPKPFYFIMTKGKNTLLQELNGALLSIEQSDPYFSTSLSEKYFSSQTKTLELSNQEKEFIKNIKTLKVGVLSNVPPFQYINEKTNELKGISIDLLDYISEKTGLRFEIVSADTQAELDSMIVNHEINLIAGMTYDYDDAQERQLAMSRPYISSQYLIMINKNMKDNNLAGKRLALPKNSKYDGYFIGDVTYFDTQKDCIEAVRSGKADYTYADSYTAQFFSNQPLYDTIRLVPQSYESHNVCFGLVKPNQRELLSILNKVITNISSDELQAIIYQSVTYRPDYTLAYYIQENTFESIVVILIIMTCIIGAMAWGLCTRIKMNRKIMIDLKKHIQVYEMASEHFFEYDYKTGKLMIYMQQEKDKTGAITFFDFNHEDDENQNELMKEQKKLFYNQIIIKKDGTEDIYFPNLDGSFSWIRIIVRTTYDDGGKPIYAIGKITNIDEEQKEKETLLNRAERDSLTQLLNSDTCRRLVSENLSNLYETEQGALLLLDIDYFKNVNDTYGHLCGDHILEEIAKVLCNSFRKDDIIGRPGGDEFLVYMKTVKDISALGNKCNIVCEKARKIYLPDGKNISISLGAAISKTGVHYDQLYIYADKALYKAKADGRNQYKIAK